MCVIFPARGAIHNSTKSDWLSRFRKRELNTTIWSNSVAAGELDLTPEIPLGEMRLFAGTPITWRQRLSRRELTACLIWHEGNELQSCVPRRFGGDAIAA